MRRDYSYSAGDDIISEHLRMIGDDADTEIDALQPESLLFNLNRLQRQVVQLPRTGLLVGPYSLPATDRRFDFLEDEKQYSILEDVALAETLASGSTGPVDITDGTGWDDANGAFMTYDSQGTPDFVKFTLRSSVTLSGLTKVGIGNASGDDAVKLYKLPTDFDEVLSIEVPDVTPSPYREVRWNPQDNQYAIRENFLWFMRDHGAKTAILRYQTRVSDLANLTGSMSTPTEMDLYYVEMLNARAYRLNGNPQADIDRAYLEARNHLLNFLISATQSTDRRVRTGYGPFRSPTG